MRHFSRLSLVSLFALAAGGAWAATSITTTFQAKIIITAQCLINSATILDFGTTGVLAANVDNTSTLSVTCTNTTPYNVGLDAGVNSGGGGVSARKMKGGPSNELIGYNIYTLATRLVTWGNTIGTDTQAFTGNGTAQSYTLFGRVPPQTTPTPGTYTDTVTVTVTY